jgi:hypothetical protein
VKVVGEVGDGCHIFFVFNFIIILLRARGSVVVKALCYKPEGHGFDSR